MFFRNLKEIFSTMDPNADPNSHAEFKKEVYELCKGYLGGAWKTVSLENMHVSKVRYIYDLPV